MLFSLHHSVVFLSHLLLCIILSYAVVFFLSRIASVFLLFNFLVE